MSADEGAALSSALEDALSSALGVRVSVQGLRRLSGGSSRENWWFELEQHGETRPMLLRRDPVTSVANTERAVERTVLDALVHEPLPTPVIVAADLDGGRLERPWMVLECNTGRADRSVLRDRDPFRLGPAGRLGLAHDLCDLLADAHRLDPATTGLGVVPVDPARNEIDRWSDEWRRVARQPQPELAYAAMWLDEHRPPPPQRPVLVHGDFRPANVLIDDDDGTGRVSVLLDWEFAHLGDPAEDVGWYLAPIYRTEHLLGDQWTATMFLERYCARSGITIEPERLRFWQVLATFKLAVIALAAVSSFLDDAGDRAAPPTDGVMRTLMREVRA